jgi:phage-related protein
VGLQIDRLQHGQQPDDFKPMRSVGKGVEEIRIRGTTGTFRLIYTARMVDMICIIHVFQKKSRTTSRRDLNIAKARFSSLMGNRT